MTLLLTLLLSAAPDGGCPTAPMTLKGIERPTLTWAAGAVLGACAHCPVGSTCRCTMPRAAPAPTEAGNDARAPVSSVEPGLLVSRSTSAQRRFELFDEAGRLAEAWWDSSAWQRAHSVTSLADGCRVEAIDVDGDQLTDERCETREPCEGSACRSCAPIRRALNGLACPEQCPRPWSRCACDGQGRPTELVDDRVHAARLVEYSDAGGVTRSQELLGDEVRTTRRYDVAGREIEALTADGRRTSSEYFDGGVNLTTTLNGEVVDRHTTLTAPAPAPAQMRRR